MKGKESTVIKHLLQNRDKELNILSMAKALKMDYKTAYSIVSRLKAQSLVTIEPFGKSNRIRLADSIHPLTFQAEYERREEVLKDKNLAVMLSTLKRSVKSKLCIILLFGSYAKGTQTKKSDIDLMLICPDGAEDTTEKGLSRVLRQLPLAIHALVFSESQFTGMQSSREPNVGQEAAKNNIILYGIEPYYELRNP